jgi:D-serine deaminase-like pyridoxal phosphate-dependent protein
MTALSATLSSAIAALPTPALVIDGAVARGNLHRLATYCASHKIGIRPHTKTHKNRFVANLQVESGALGLTVAKVGEAEELQSATADLLMAYPAIDPSRCERLAKLAHSRTVRVIVDSETGIQNLAAAATAARTTLGVLVDLDVGMGRTGVATAAESLSLAQSIDGRPGLRLDGILCYPGQIWDPIDKQAGPLAAVSARLQEALELWKKSGLEAGIVSGGSTPTAFQSHQVKQYTEIRPGTYVFNDMNTFRGGFCELDHCAARIICTVVSTAVKGQVVIDGGTKTFTSDICIPARESGHGYILEYPDAKLTKLSEEHGQVDMSQCSKRPKVGDRLSIIPNHICPCVNLRNDIWWAEEDGGLKSIKIDARGKLS